MTTLQLEKKILQLERMNKKMISELILLDGLTREIGFIEGLNSLKRTAEKMKKDS